MNRRLVWVHEDEPVNALASRVTPAGLTREPRAAFGLALPGFVVRAGVAAVG